ncbi:MAG: hypothetical protein VW338_06745 [Rhodospirillaceae bacterium]
MVSKMTTAQTRLAAAALDALGAVDDVLATPKGSPSKAQPQALYAYATDPSYQPDATLLRLLHGDARTQADFQRLLENTASYYIPRMAAASSGEIGARETDGLKIQFRASKADAGQVYAILEIADIDAQPKVLFVKHPDGHLDRLELPAFRDGRVQLLLEGDASAMKGLMDINAEVYVR